MNIRFVGALGLLFLMPLAAWSQTTTANTTVRFETSQGAIDVTLIPSAAPLTVTNFLNYVNKGAYTKSIFHRSVPGFIIQGGGFGYANGAFTTIAADAAVKNEPVLSNVRGTIAMAKLGSDPNSATNQWFFNLADNSGNLDSQNGGFTVFGRVLDAASLAVMDKIAALPVPTNTGLGSPYDTLPLSGYSGGTVQEANLVFVNAITVIDGPPPPTISDGGIITASAFGGYHVAAPATHIEIYGAGFSGSTRTWTNRDFVGGNAPTSLDGVSVTANGRPTYISYVSPTQINVQIPSTVTPGLSLPIVVNYNGQTTAVSYIEVKTLTAGLLAPASFNVGGKQYVTALHGDNSYVTNGNIPDVAGSPALPGEVIVLYGIGFGAIDPFDVPIAGRKVDAGQLTSLKNPVEIKIDGQICRVDYAGLAPGFVGLYQFNVAVPSSTAGGDVTMEVSQGGQRLNQNLFLAVKPR